MEEIAGYVMDENEEFEFRARAEREALGNRDAQAPFANGPLKMGKERFADDLRAELQGADWATRNIAGAGTAVSNLWERGKQAIGQGDEQAIQANRIMAEEAPIGAIAGNVALLAPTMMIPGANTIVGSGIVGGATGALQPTLSGESTLDNILTGTGFGIAGKVGGDAIAKGLRARLSQKMAELATKKAQNAPIDQTLREGLEAGYVVPPSMRNDSGVMTRLAEGMSGKLKLNQLAGIKNQEVTDKLARQAVGMAPDSPLTSEAMQTIRKQAYQQGYEPVAKIGQMAADADYTKALDAVSKKYTGAAGSFKNAIPDEVGKLVDSFRVPGFDAGDALQASQALRDQANAAFRAGDTGTAKAAKDIAKALEDQIERNLSPSGVGSVVHPVTQSNGQTVYMTGADMLKGFRDARQLMAKAHTVEDAIREGGGKVDARKLGSRLQSGKYLDKELKTIGQFANNFGDVAGIPKSGAANPITALDTLVYGPAGMMTGGAALAIPAARIGARYGLLSKTGQRAMGGSPNYSPNTLLQLLEGGSNNELVRRMLPGVIAGEAVRSP